jgi:hypothetical protein
MMQPTRSLMQRKKNLLIAFDAFGTLFHPRVSVAEQYRALSREHGINLPTEVSKINAAFGDAWKSESTEHPNFGRAAGIGPEKWWGNVSIHFTALVMAILFNHEEYSGYGMFPATMRH